MTASQTTAYAFNTRPGLRDRGPLPRPKHCCERLARADYALAKVVPDSPAAVLFRALTPLTVRDLVADRLAPNRLRHSLCALERELGALLVSHEVSDAVTVSGLMSPDSDSAIAVIPATSFIARQQAGEAGVLNFAEPGVVFKYPFMAEPLAFSELLALFVTRRCLSRLRVNRSFRALAQHHAGDLSLLALHGQEVPVIGLRESTRGGLEQLLEARLAKAGVRGVRWQSPH